MTLHLFKKSREYSHALSGVIMTGGLGKGAVALRDLEYSVTKSRNLIG